MGFWAETYKSGVGYYFVATTWSALPSLLNSINGLTFGKQEIIKQYIKVIHNLRPALPKQMAI